MNCADKYTRMKGSGGEVCGGHLWWDGMWVGCGEVEAQRG